MEIDGPFTLDSLTEFMADDRNIYLTVHADGRLAGTLHAGYLHPAGERALRQRGHVVGLVPGRARASRFAHMASSRGLPGAAITPIG